MAKRYDTVSECPWCGNVPAAGDAKCKCGLVLPKPSDFEFGLEYYDASHVSGSKHNMVKLFGGICHAAVGGNETYMKYVLRGNCGLEDPNEWKDTPGALKAVMAAADKGFKWAKFCLGYFYFHGWFGLERDYAKAKTLMYAAGNTKEDPVTSWRAFQHLCMCRFDGVGGVERDVDKAIYWLLKLKKANLEEYYKTVCMMLNRTDLCRSGEFRTGSWGRGWPKGPKSWDKERWLMKAIWTPKKGFVDEGTKKKSKEEYNGLKEEPFSFMDQVDMRQLNALFEEARVKFGKYSKPANGKIGVTYKVLVRSGYVGCCEDKYETYEMFFYDLKYYDTVYLKHRLLFDHYLFSDFDAYFKKLKAIEYSCVNYNYPSQSAYHNVKHNIPIDLGFCQFSKFLRRYILSDRKAGIILWDGSVQKECNAKTANVPISIEGSKTGSGSPSTNKNSSSSKTTSAGSKTNNSKAQCGNPKQKTVALPKTEETSKPTPKKCGHKMSESSAPKPKDDTDTHVMTAKEFFGESTEEEVDDSENNGCQEIDWDDDVHKSDLEIPLDDDVMGGIIHNLKKLKKKANKGRLLLEGNEGFDHKIDNFLKEFNGRINGENFAPVIKNTAVAMFDYGVKGIGKRGFVITPIGIFYINNTYPTLVNGDMVGGFVPWKIFYKFVKHNEKAHYWFVRSSDILSSNDVDDDVKESCSTPVEDLVEKMYYNGASEDASGLSADVMSDYLECLKKDISCTHEMTVADFFGEGDNETKKMSTI